MLLAFTSDAANIDGVDVVTTWDSRLGPFPLNTQGSTNGIDARVVRSNDEEIRCFLELCRSSDAVCVIAPETENLLQIRHEMVRETGGLWIGASRSAIQIASDKLITAQQLAKSGVSTVSTVALCDVHQLPVGPIVVKPRDGAGADETFVVEHTTKETDLSFKLQLTRASEHYIAQPFIDADAVSCFCVVSNNQLNTPPEFHVFPLVRQRISKIGNRLQYQGGMLPLNPLPKNGKSTHSVAIEPNRQHLILKKLVADGLSAIGASQGHFGVDILIPNDGSAPMIVEINPRLTTSYIGYREILNDNVAERILFPERFDTLFKNNGRHIHFDTTGNATEFAQA